MKAQRCYNGVLTCKAWKCANTFKPRTSGGSPQKYCSVRCKNRDMSRKRYRENKHKCAAANALSHSKHKGARNKQQRKYYHSTQEQQKLKSRIYQLRFPEKQRERSRISDNKRRAAKKSAGARTLTTAQWSNILALYEYRCAYCGSFLRLSQDHVIALSRGGSHTADNVVPACMPCNSQKGAKTLEDFIATRATLLQ